MKQMLICGPNLPNVLLLLMFLRRLCRSHLAMSRIHSLSMIAGKYNNTWIGSCLCESRAEIKNEVQRQRIAYIFSRTLTSYHVAFTSSALLLVVGICTDKNKHSRPTTTELRSLTNFIALLTSLPTSVYLHHPTMPKSAHFKCRMDYVLFNMIFFL